MERDDQSRTRVIALIAGLLALGAIVLLVVLTRDDEGDADNGSASAGGCEFVDKPAPKREELDPPDEVLEPGGEAVAVVDTSCGEFEITLDTERAPKTANSFAYLAEEGFYDDLTFHRIAPGFVIQGGDPLGTGVGGPGYSVDEPPPQDLRYTKGIVAMAKSGADPPGRSGSQFFIVTGAAAPLPPQYALVGQVTDGIEVVERIGRLGTPTERPRRTVLIESIEIEEG